VEEALSRSISVAGSGLNLEFARYKIMFERSYSDISIGRNIDEAIELAMAYGPAGEIIRLAEAEGEKLKPKVMNGLRKVLGNYVRENGSVWAPSSAWLVSAYNPR
jgi:hypothetical protein